MNKKLITILIALVVIVGGGFYAVNASRGDKNQKANQSVAIMEKKDQDSVSMKKAEGEAMKKGSAYITYADYTAKKDSYKDAHVVLYFHAPWCPTCQALDKNITENLTNLPANTVIVKTDYDSSTDLKKTYGVTYQHTLVQVDSSGNKIKKWSGSPELKDLVAEIQA